MPSLPRRSIDTISDDDTLGVIEAEERSTSSFPGEDGKFSELIISHAAVT